jgi:hypothetical protein
MAKRVPSASIGFTIKSGWAAVVLLTGSAADPHVSSSARVELCDPDDPDQRQPYHAGFGTARANDATLARLLNGVQKYGGRSVDAALRSCRDSGHEIAVAGVVVGSTVDPATIANDHIRIHALEGQLFREVVMTAAEANGVACTVWRERDLYAAAARALNRSESSLKAALAAWKTSVTGGWRSEQKAAALAAWILLSGQPRSTVRA